MFFLDKDTMLDLVWITPAKVGQKSRIALKSVTGFVFGYKSKLFVKHAKFLGAKENQAVSIKYVNEGGSEASLDLVFESVQDKELFISAIQYLVMREKCGFILSTQYDFE